MLNIIIWVISTLSLVTGGAYLVSKTDFGKDVGLDKVFEFQDDKNISNKTTADDKILEDSLKMKDNKTFSNLKEEERVLIERLKSLDKNYDEVVKRFLIAYQKNFELKNKLSQNLEKTLKCAGVDAKKISAEFLKEKFEKDNLKTALKDNKKARKKTPIDNKKVEKIKIDKDDGQKKDETEKEEVVEEIKKPVVDEAKTSPF